MIAALGWAGMLTALVGAILLVADQVRGDVPLGDAAPLLDRRRSFRPSVTERRARPSPQQGGHQRVPRFGIVPIEKSRHGEIDGSCRKREHGSPPHCSQRLGLERAAELDVLAPLVEAPGAHQSPGVEVLAARRALRPPDHTMLLDPQARERQSQKIGFNGRWLADLALVRPGRGPGPAAARAGSLR